MRRWLCVAGLQSVLALGAFGQAPAPAPPGITLELLLTEMTDRSSLARVADPPYTCRQFSSYDRASKTPDDPATWFANDDVGKFLREEDVPGEGGKPRHEFVMADMDGPGAVVRVWSANPKGTLRVYLDGTAAAALDAAVAGPWGNRTAALSGAPMCRRAAESAAIKDRILSTQP